MAKANEQLDAEINQQGIAAFSIEHDERCSDSEPGPQIELDLTCGLLDLQDDVAIAAAARAAAAQRDEQIHDDESSDDSSSSDISAAACDDAALEVKCNSSSKGSSQQARVSIAQGAPDAGAKLDHTQAHARQHKGLRHSASNDGNRRKHAARPSIQVL